MCLWNRIHSLPLIYNVAAVTVTGTAIFTAVIDTVSVIASRDRVQHLAVMLSRLHPLLRRQQLHYTVYVVEQVGYTACTKRST